MAREGVPAGLNNGRNGRGALAGVMALALLVLLAGGAAWMRLHGDAAGTILQAIALDQAPAAVAVDGRTGRVFVIAACRAPPARVASTLLDARSGAVLGSVPVCGEAVAVDEQAGTVLVPGDGGVTILDAASGRLLHTVAMAVTPDTVAVDARAGHAFVVNAGSNTVSMLDTRTGAILRTVGLIMPPTVVAADAQAGRVFVASDSPFIAVLDARSGALLRSGAVRVSPAAMAVDASPRGGEAGERAIMTNLPASSVSVVDLGSGLIERTVALGMLPVAVVLDAATHRAYVAARSVVYPFNTPVTGAIAVLDARSGAVRRTIPLASAPAALALDARSGHLFVANLGGFVVEPDRWSWLPTPLRRWLPFLPPPGAQLRTVPPSLTMLAV